jgi:hypothetical protein
LRQISTHDDGIFALTVSGWVVAPPDSNALKTSPFVKTQGAQIGRPNFKHNGVNAASPQHPQEMTQQS